jgi:membrane protein implicated in regulation of membrane protease activity
MITALIIAVVDISTTGYFFPFAIALFFTGVLSIYVKSPTFLYIFFGIQVVLYYAFFILWNKKFKVKLDEEKEGFVKKKENGFYIIDFPTGFKGEVRWKAISETPLDIGDRVKVKKIDGNILIVEKA